MNGNATDKDQKLFHFVVKPLYRKEDLQHIASMMKRNAVVYGKLLTLGIPFEIVDNGTLLMTIVSESSFGDQKINISNEVNDENINNGYYYTFAKTGRYVIESDNKVNSGMEGIFVIKNGIPDIIPVNFDAAFDFIVSDDQMEVLLNLYPSGIGDYESLNLEQIISDYNDQGFKVKPDVEKIKSALEEIQKTNEPMLDLKIAEGLPAVDGKDGWLEYFVQIKELHGPSITEDGRVDFYNLGLVNPIAKGDRVLLFHPHEQGKPGHNVFGHEIEPREPVQCDLPDINNTAFSPDNPRLIISKVDGNVTFANDRVIISDVFSIRGNIDIKTGNIETKGSLDVKGDIMSNMKVKAVYSVQVNGVVEDAQIETGSQCVIRRGFIGKGEGVIRSKGDVNVRYVEHQTIYSRQSIFINSQAINARLFARDEIQIGGGKNCIVGGYTFAGNLVEADSLGNLYGTPTTVEVGYDYQLDLEFKDNSALMDSIEEKIVKVNETVARMAKKASINEQTKKNLQILAEQKKLMEKKLVALKERNAKIKTIMHKPSSARIKVHKYINRGVKIIINKKHFLVQEEMNNKTFYLDKDEELVYA